jgi:hypothetical protein
VMWMTSMHKASVWETWCVVCVSLCREMHVHGAAEGAAFYYACLGVGLGCTRTIKGQR